MTSTCSRLRHHNIIVVQKRLKRKKRKIAIREANRRGFAKFQECLLDPQSRLSPRVIYAPMFFTLVRRKRRGELLDFIASIQRRVQKGQRVYIDFSRTVKMFADGTLLFYAELHRLVSKSPLKKFIGCSYPEDKIVEQVLQHVGVFDMLRKPPRAKIEHDTVKHWKAATGNDVDGERIALVPEAYQDAMSSPLSPTRLYAG